MNTNNIDKLGNLVYNISWFFDYKEVIVYVRTKIQGVV